ncbi:alpha/beta hydrolase [Archangium violaceum]|uniref:Alpha/beta hydrolase n=1 Tax=Archangium violaceum Cb vi76 TaxID=1406225 RepID=A0A084T041_9BACT|nr:alpha/beta hydrolase [Archangium violaceum]KFA94076.1 alpha/beta hydrolase [Archangium violaceum Cb vi76]
MTQTRTTPDTIVLIHGLWMTPRSWEHWSERFKSRGFKVLAPAYPGLEVEVEALRKDPSPIEKLTIEHVAHYYETFIRGLESPPIIMGHSFGGALTQMMLDRGLGAAGVAIDSVPTKGVLRLPLTTIKATFPVLGNPANRHRAVPFTHEQFHYAFTNTLTEEKSRAAYERYHVPAPGRFVFDGALANFNPHAPTKVDFDKEDRAPLLFIAGAEDNIMPAAVNKSNARHYNTGIVAYKEYAGRCHFTVGQDGWEEVADYALSWALNPTA